MPDRANPLPSTLSRPTDPTGLGNFHKTLPHDADGFVMKKNFDDFRQITLTGSDFEDVVQSPDATALVDPQAGWAHDHLGPDPRAMHMDPPPPAKSNGTAAEMTELYWMALLRDKPFDSFDTDADVASAVKEIKASYSRDDVRKDVRPGEDLPANITAQTVFRAGLPGEDAGPLVSQFFLHDIAYGTQIILQKQFPYRAGPQWDYLTVWEDWMEAQNTGKGKDGKPYAEDNDFDKNKKYFEDHAYEGQDGLKRIRNMRDLARFVNKDALHQAYFNAALLLNNWGAPVDKGSPYSKDPSAPVRYQKQGGFGTLGGPHLLAQVSEVAARALRVVWRQKWHVHLRFRPEAYGGLMESQRRNKDYSLGLPDWVFKTDAAERVLKTYGTHLLPMAFTAGSPAHPAYGAGHATVAGACVTILKAWFDETTLMTTAMAKAIHPITRKPVQIVAPNAAGSDILLPYDRDTSQMTVGSELNKLAANVALGRSMGGVHWRTDNTRSLRLGEQIATIILKRESRDYHEKPTWSYMNFDKQKVTIEPDGYVTVDGNPKLTKFYNEYQFAPHTKAFGAGA